jgi:hypothetical protein
LDLIGGNRLLLPRTHCRGGGDAAFVELLEIYVV